MQNNSYTLHRRLTMISLVIGLLATIIYVSFTLVIVGKLEDAMIATMVGHEIDELVVELHNDPNAKMPKTSSVNGYLKSREHLEAIPEYLKVLEPNIYNNINIGDKTFQAIVVDLGSDQLFVEFDVTGASEYRAILLILLIGGGIFAAIVLVISAVWLFRKFLLPVSQLAEEVANVSPDDRNVRIETRYQDYEVGLIAKSFDQFMARLDEFVEREQSFAAAVSHELRTPISVVVTAIDLLELRGVASNQKAAINRIKESTVYMEKVIESLLFFARNTHDVVEKTLPEIDLDAFFSRILQEHEVQAREKGLVLLLEVKSKTKTRMSENHLEIVLGNLLRNAISNTSSGEVKVSLHENGFSVADTGHGIDPEEIDLIASRNYHGLDSTGYGLGLYLVENICNIYGLKLEIESILGEGSKFVVTLPDDLKISGQG